jgi:hypothetical protein
MGAAAAVVAELIPWQQMSLSYPAIHIPIRSVLAELLVQAAAVALAAREAIPVFQALQRQPVAWVVGVCRRIRVLEMGLMARVPVVSRPQTITAEMVLLGQRGLPVSVTAAAAAAVDLPA